MAGGVPLHLQWPAHGLWGGDRGMYTQMGRERQPDDFSHEQYLVLEEGGRRVVFSGCSHKGICNIAAWLRPDVLIGGFHLREDADPAWWSRWGGGCWRWGAYTIPATAPARGPMPG